jgi:hypothetical protein
MSVASWSELPPDAKRAIRTLWDCSSRFESETTKLASGEEVSVHRLTSNKVGMYPECLTTDQKIALFNVAFRANVPMADLLNSLTYETETVKVNSDMYIVPARILGIWPPSNSYGCMLEDGSIHT